jgi:hypothetical protein
LSIREKRLEQERLEREREQQELQEKESGQRYAFEKKQKEEEDERKRKDQENLRLRQEKEARERSERERLERERAEKERFEKERLEKERAEREAIERQVAQAQPAPDAPTAPASGLEAIALYDYTKDEDNEIDLKEGELITNVVEEEGGWYCGTNSKGETGYFPGNYVELRPSAGVAVEQSLPEAVQYQQEEVATAPPPVQESGLTAIAQVNDFLR